MDREYHPLPIRELGDGAGYRRPIQAQAARVTRESPALEVMTDLLRSSPATIRPQAPIEGANHYMISRGVRLLLVVDERDAVLGVVTATDVLGEKSMRVAQELGRRRGELGVGDIMTPARQVEVLALADVEAARVGHVLETLARAGRGVYEGQLQPPRAGRWHVVLEQGDWRLTGDWTLPSAGGLTLGARAALPAAGAGYSREGKQ